VTLATDGGLMGKALMGHADQRCPSCLSIGFGNPLLCFRCRVEHAEHCPDGDACTLQRLMVADSKLKVMRRRRLARNDTPRGPVRGAPGP